MRVQIRFLYGGQRHIFSKEMPINNVSAKGSILTLTRLCHIWAFPLNVKHGVIELPPFERQPTDAEYNEFLKEGWRNDEAQAAA